MIDERVDAMFGAGLIEEVETLLLKRPDRTAMQAIGYKELTLYLNREIDKDEAIRLIKRNTRRYAKRQFTWFRREEDISWVDVTGMLDSREILCPIKNALTQAQPEIFSCNASGR